MTQILSDKLEKIRLNFSRCANRDIASLNVDLVSLCRYMYVLSFNVLRVSVLFCFVCRPVVITDIVRNWKAMNWTKSFLVSNYGDKRVSMKATEVRWCSDLLH